MTPDRFREELKRFDKRLDFVFNGPKGCYEVVGVDVKNKKYLIKAIPLGQLSALGLDVIQELYECSPTKQGGAAALNKRIDDLKAEEERQEEKRLRDELEARHEDAYAHFQYREGTRISFANAGGGEESPRVTDRRRIHNEVN